MRRPTGRSMRRPTHYRSTVGRLSADCRSTVGGLFQICPKALGSWHLFWSILSEIAPLAMVEKVHWIAPASASDLWSWSFVSGTLLKRTVVLFVNKETTLYSKEQPHNVTIRYTGVKYKNADFASDGKTELCWLTRQTGLHLIGDMTRWSQRGAPRSKFFLNRWSGAKYYILEKRKTRKQFRTTLSSQG